MRYLDRLAGDLEAAAAKGVVSVEQARLVRELAAERLDAGSIRGVTWIAMFAGLSIAAGLSLIIAHNWEDIPALVKIGSFLAVLAAAGGAALWTQEGSAARGVPLEVLWLVLPLLGIGLYAQIFQLSGDPAKPYLVWLALTAPVAFGSARGVAAPLHAASAILVLLWFTFSDGGALSLHRTEIGHVRFSTWLWLLALLGLLGAEIRERLSGRRRVWAGGALLLWVAFLLVRDTPFKLGDDALQVMAALLAALAWAAAAPRLAGPDDSRSARLAALGALYFATFLWHWRPGGHSYYYDTGGAAPGLTLVLLLAGGCGGLIAFAPKGLLGDDAAWELRAKAALGAGWVLALLLFGPSAGVLKGVAIGANVLVVILGVGLMWHGSTAGRVGQINEGALALFLLLVTRVIDVFGSFLQGGAAFIGMGLMLSGVAYALHHGRRVMVARAKQGGAAA